MRVLLLKMYFLICILTISCHSSTEKKSVLNPNYSFPITSLSDESYPDNPDIGFRSKNYSTHYFENGQIDVLEKHQFNFTFYSLNQKDTIEFKNIQLLEFIPTIPSYAKEDEYLSYIALVNQEWNRNQVEFTSKHFNSSDKSITRIDIARNCLNAYLWEIIAYTKEDGVQTPIYHGWFNFPQKLYQDLFVLKNQTTFDKYREGLENWIDPASKKINRQLLRKVIQEQVVSNIANNDSMYPLKKARLKKRKEVIYPTKFNFMKELLSDSTLFATFSPPGYYNKKDPRKTELGRFQNLDSTYFRTIISTSTLDTLVEVELTFNDNQQRITKFIVGGINPKLFPVLDNDSANSGWKSSMGFSNHPFYEKYDSHISCQTKKNPYYAYLCNEKEEWLDSHKIGIDGPIFYWDKNSPGTLHLWILSFERHALVGHYIIKTDLKLNH